jgi:hypothetical protein
MFQEAYINKHFFNENDYGLKHGNYEYHWNTCQLAKFVLVCNNSFTE